MDDFLGRYLYTFKEEVTYGDVFTLLAELGFVIPFKAGAFELRGQADEMMEALGMGPKKPPYAFMDNATRIRNGGLARLTMVDEKWKKLDPDSGEPSEAVESREALYTIVQLLRTPTIRQRLEEMAADRTPIDPAKQNAAI